MHDDARGLTTTASDPRALEAYERALHAFQTYRGDPLAPLDEAIRIDPGFAAAYAAKALILCTVFERRFMREALATLEAGRDALERANPRERALAEAAATLAVGRWHAGVPNLARHYLQERLTAKPGGAWGARLAARAASRPPARALAA